MKSLYSFTVDKEVEVEKTETNEVDGLKTTTTKKVKEKRPIEFVFKKPSRADKEEAEIVRAAYLSEYIRRGIMTEAILLKTYANQGGIMDEGQKKLYTQYNLDLFAKKNEYQLVSAEKEKADVILKEIVELQRKITELQYDQNIFFENTAEFKAKTKLIEYLCVFLTYIRHEGKEPEPYFKGVTFEEKIVSLNALEDEDDEIYVQIRGKLLLVASLYVHLSGNVKPSDIEAVLDDKTL